MEFNDKWSRIPRAACVFYVLLNFAFNNILSRSVLPKSTASPAQRVLYSHCVVVLLPTAYKPSLRETKIKNGVLTSFPPFNIYIFLYLASHLAVSSNLGLLSFFAAHVSSLFSYTECFTWCMQFRVQFLLYLQHRVSVRFGTHVSGKSLPSVFSDTYS